jgi:hypothetical protein
LHSLNELVVAFLVLLVELFKAGVAVVENRVCRVSVLPSSVLRGTAFKVNTVVYSCCVIVVGTFNYISRISGAHGHAGSVVEHGIRIFESFIEVPDEQIRIIFNSCVPSTNSALIVNRSENLFNVSIHVSVDTEVYAENNGSCEDNAANRVCTLSLLLFPVLECSWDLECFGPLFHRLVVVFVAEILTSVVLLRSFTFLWH